MDRVRFSLYDFTRPQLAGRLSAAGFSAGHALPLWRAIYHADATSFAAMHELPVRLRDWLTENATLAMSPAVQEIASADGLTQKYLLELADGAKIETVRMLYGERTTACVSSQAGCALGCVFCATGQAGFTRNLAAGEIVEQVLHVRRVPGAAPLKNIVLMGMGEPLLNYDAVIAAVEILCDPAGLAIGGKQVTLSTVGIVPGIVRLADEKRPISLAVSLHGAEQEERAALVPIARAWPLAELMDACRYYSVKAKRKVFFEWTLIAGQNDSPQQARALAELLRDIDCQVNLIPLNPTAGYAGEPGEKSALDRFRETLQANDIPVSIRQRRGIDVAAGCGQLAGAP